MSVFEKIVRPAQLGDISPPKPQSSGTVDQISADQETTLTFGKGGSAKLMFGSQTIDETFYAVKKMREKPKT
jgi:hypothetical protein